LPARVAVLEKAFHELNHGDGDNRNADMFEKNWVRQAGG
jgi:hypothetical protein